jgi:hypothetical protein
VYLLAFLYHSIQTFFMVENNRTRNEKQNNEGKKQNAKRSGQETMGKRGQKLEKDEREGYRSSEQKRQRGNHGGNR